MQTRIRPYTLMFWFTYSETDELVAVVEFLESKSEVNPKEIALEKRKEMKKKRDIKSPGKKKGKKGEIFTTDLQACEQVFYLISSGE